MNTVTLTTVIGLVIMAVGTIGFPMYVNRQKNSNTAAERKSVDSQSVAKMFKDERDRLQIRLDTMQANYEQRIEALRRENERALATAEASWQAQHDKDQAQIRELRDELQGLYRQLYQQRPP